MTGVLLQAQQLEALEILMTLCEHLRCLEAAAKFAQAATHEILQLEQSAPAEFQEDLLAREGRVWANLFTYALDSSQYQVFSLWHRKACGGITCVSQ